MSRRVYQMVELTQKRCSNRFGVGACGAEGTPKCYQTFATCRFKDAFDLDGRFRWRFVPVGQPHVDLYERRSDNDFSSHGYPVVTSISQRPTRLNLAAGRQGESPIGIRSELRVSFNDFAFDDRDGDFYVADRDITPASFWGKFVKRIGPAIQKLEARHYQWYEGQDYTDGVVSLFDVESLVYDGTGATLIGADPLQRTDALKARFPRATGGTLRTDIDAVQTTGIEAFVSESELNTAYGNTGADKFLRIKDEILQYTGHITGTDGARLLTGVTRGVLKTQTASHRANDSIQRVGVYRNIRLYRIALDLLQNHSTIDNSLIDAAQWEAEGDRHLPTFSVIEAVIPAPEDVRKLLGELARDGLFNIWWDERTQSIPLLAVRPPEEAVIDWSDRANLINSSFDVRPDDRLTRVTLFYDQRKYTGVSDEFGNFRTVYIRPNVEAEGPFFADGTVRERQISSRWITSDSHALLVAANLERALTQPPEYVSATLDAKDETVGIGDVIDISSEADIDFEGKPQTRRWSLIERTPIDPGFQISVRLQSSPYQGRFTTIMADDTLSYADTPEDEREPGAFFADGNTNLMPNGDDPYLLR